MGNTNTKEELQREGERMKTSLRNKLSLAQELNNRSLATETADFSNIREKLLNVIDEMQDDVRQYESNKEKISSKFWFSSFDPGSEIKQKLRKEIDDLVKEVKRVIEKGEEVREEISNICASEKTRKHKAVVEINQDLQKSKTEISEKAKEAMDKSDKTVATLEEEKHVIMMKELENKAQIQQVKRALEFNMVKFETEKSKRSQITNNLNDVKEKFHQLGIRFSEIQRETTKVTVAMAKGTSSQHNLKSFTELLDETIRDLNNFSGIGGDTGEKAVNDDELKAIRDKLRDFKSKYEELIEVIDEYESGEADKDRAEKSKKIRSELKKKMIEIQSRITEIKPPQPMSEHPAESVLKLIQRGGVESFAIEDTTEKKQIEGE